MVTAGFFHDARIAKGDQGRMHSIGFPYQLWQRYLEVFDDLQIVTRQVTEDNLALPISSGPNVSFSGIGSYVNRLDPMLKSGRIRQEVAREVEKVDCAVVRLPSVIGAAAVAEARKQGKRVMIELVGCPWDALSNHSLLGRLAAPFAFIRTRRIVRKADFILYVTSEFLQKRYPTKGLSVGCSDVVIPPQSPLLLEERISRTAANENGISFTVATIAGLDVKYKGQQYVIKAIARLAAEGIRINYLLIGGGDGKRLRKLANRLGIAEQIIVVGRLPHDEVLQKLGHEVDLYIQPSQQEGLPRSVVEAMSVGCPVIGSRAGGTPELVPDEWTYDARDIGRLAALLRVVPGHFGEMAVRNYEHVEQNFSSGRLRERRRAFMERFSSCVRNG